MTLLKERAEEFNGGGGVGRRGVEGVSFVRWVKLKYSGALHTSLLSSWVLLAFIQPPQQIHVVVLGDSCVMCSTLNHGYRYLNQIPIQSSLYTSGR